MSGCGVRVLGRLGVGVQATARTYYLAFGVLGRWVLDHLSSGMSTFVLRSGDLFLINLVETRAEHLQFGGCGSP